MEIKYHGAMDLQMIGLNNLAKVEGITKIAGDNVKVRFVSVEDEKVTPMCDSLNEQIFNIKGYNEFTRYYGNTVKELELKKFKIYGLVLRYQYATCTISLSLL